MSAESKRHKCPTSGEPSASTSPIYRAELYACTEPWLHSTITYLLGLEGQLKAKDAMLTASEEHTRHWEKRARDLEGQLEAATSEDFSLVPKAEYEQLKDAVEEGWGWKGEYERLRRHAESVRDAWLLYENDVDDAHLTSVCSDLNQFLDDAVSSPASSPERLRHSDGLCKPASPESATNIPYQEKEPGP